MTDDWRATLVYITGFSLATLLLALAIAFLLAA